MAGRWYSRKSGGRSSALAEIFSEHSIARNSSVTASILPFRMISSSLDFGYPQNALKISAQFFGSKLFRDAIYITVPSCHTASSDGLSGKRLSGSHPEIALRAIFLLG